MMFFCELFDRDGISSGKYRLHSALGGVASDQLTGVTVRTIDKKCSSHGMIMRQHRSEPGAVATGFPLSAELPEGNPVATAPGSDLCRTISIPTLASLSTSAKNPFAVFPSPLPP